MKKWMRRLDELLALIPYFMFGVLALPIIPLMFIARIGKRLKNKGLKVNWSNPEVWF